MSRIWSTIKNGLSWVASFSDRPSTPVLEPSGDVFLSDFEIPRESYITQDAASFLRSFVGSGRLTDRKGRIISIIVAYWMSETAWEISTARDIELAHQLADGTLSDAERIAALTGAPLNRAILNWSGVQAAYHVLRYCGLDDPNQAERIGTPGVDHFHRLISDPLPPLEWKGPFESSWQTSAAVSLAMTIDSTGDFHLLPLLADVLEEAGCIDSAILAHCRGPDVHAYGCWVVDLVLGKK